MVIISFYKMILGPPEWSSGPVLRSEVWDKDHIYDTTYGDVEVPSPLLYVVPGFKDIAGRTPK
jgi:hypothetical protein